jgi:tRNA G10  N-methylase Trm11
LILSARVGSNAVVFADLLRLHVPKGSLVADVTYGKGAFWRDIPADDYRLAASDLQTGTDCTRLPYPDNTIDALVLDPPYMEGHFRPTTTQLAGTGTHRSFRSRYSHSEATHDGPKYHEAVLDLYHRAGAEAHRVLRPRGTFIVKCQDEVSAGRQRLTHIELVNHYADQFSAKDIFVVIRAQRPGVSRIRRQLHARKNHSYFLVFIAR